MEKTSPTAESTRSFWTKKVDPRPRDQVWTGPATHGPDEGPRSTTPVLTGAIQAKEPGSAAGMFVQCKPDAFPQTLNVQTTGMGTLSFLRCGVLLQMWNECLRFSSHRWIGPPETQRQCNVGKCRRSLQMIPARHRMEPITTQLKFPVTAEFYKSKFRFLEVKGVLPVGQQVIRLEPNETGMP